MGLPTDAICQQMLAQFDKGLALANMAKRSLEGQLSTITNQLNSFTNFSALQDIEDAAHNALDMFGSNLPDFSNVGSYNEFLDVINSCNFLKNDKKLSDPLKLLNSLQSSLLSGASSILDDAFDLIPEIQLGNALNGIIDKFGTKGFNFSESIPGLDGVLTCLSAICGEDISSRLNELQDLTDTLKIKDDGSFNMDQVMDDAGIGSQRENFSKITDTAQGMATSSTDAVSQGKAMFKNFKKGIF